MSEAQSSTARSMFYSLLARALLVPDERLHEEARDGTIAAAAAELAGALPYPLPADGLPDAPAFLEFQSDYIDFFELGKKSPPCPLYEGAVRSDQPRKGLMEELIRFYEYFGLGMSAEGKELPDQLSVELEFMHYLSFLETGLHLKGENGGGLMSIVLAQRDFLSRHLALWVPELARRAAEKGPAWQSAVLRLLAHFVQADLAWIENKTCG